MKFLDYLFVLLQYVIPQHGLSRLYARLAQSRVRWLKNFMINTFIRAYSVNMSEAEKTDPTAYASFNEFFTRPLIEGARPVPPEPNRILSPVDGSIYQFGRIEEGQLLQAKGHRFSVNALLAAEKKESEQFHAGSFITIYLAPKDYHRVHMPFEGTLTKMTYVPGRLFSVNPATTQYVEGLFARNERVLCHFNTSLGPMVVVLVGAMIVAGINTVWHGDVAPDKKRNISHYSYPSSSNETINLTRAAELGYFMCGSTVIVLFASGSIAWDKSLVINQHVQMGQGIGNV